MSNYIKGLVSVVIPTYRRSDMLDRAIKSVLNQSYENIELLLEKKSYTAVAALLRLKVFMEKRSLAYWR